MLDKRTRPIAQYSFDPLWLPRYKVKADLVVDTSFAYPDTMGTPTSNLILNLETSYTIEAKERAYPPKYCKNLRLMRLFRNPASCSIDALENKT